MAVVTSQLQAPMISLLRESPHQSKWWKALTASGSTSSITKFLLLLLMHELQFFYLLFVYSSVSGTLIVVLTVRETKIKEKDRVLLLAHD